MSFDFTLFNATTQKALTHVVKDINTLRTGKANIQLLDSVEVEAYGARMKISEVAGITVPDPNMILISPWDKSLMSAIEKGVNEANLNLSPVVDGNMIRIVVPSLTEERRKEMVRLLFQKIENGRVMIRSIRTDTKKEIDKQKGQPGMSEDMIETDLEQLEKKVKEQLDKLELLLKAKEKELMTI